MLRSRGDVVSPRRAALVLFAINIIALTRAGPLGPLPNVTSADLGFKEGSCALGDVVYMPGDEFPGATPCERCACTRGGVRCEKQQCEPRPGCKALHRPDHCCPTYQCECEQEGRVYGNGEKLVDPADPCRVCYCQGGEVVCRRIACFVRDDCTPRLVPGRCCPEYDNCPLRGVTSLPGQSSLIPSAANGDEVEPPPTPPKENIKQEITIKEITPVSEIPVITDVKIKEILPSPNIEVAEYSSSKSPLIPREATSEKNIEKSDSKTESPSVVEVHLSPASSSISTQFSSSDNKEVDVTPSKISFSTQDSIHSSIYPSNIPIVATMGIPPVPSEPQPVPTSKAPIVEEEDSFDHNPAFPPLPDDLAVLRNHEDEIVPEQVPENEHVHDILANAPTSTEAEIKESEPQTTTKYIPDIISTTITEAPKTTPTVTTLEPEITITTEVPSFKESPMLNLRSAIPTEILNSPSLAPEEISRESDEKITVSEEIPTADMRTTESPKIEKIFTEVPETSTETKTTTAEVRTTSVDIKTSSEVVTSSEVASSSEAASSSEGSSTAEFDSTTAKETETESEESTNEQEQTTSSIAKSNIATEVTSQTELSSLPIETSDQNPPEVSEQTTSDKAAPSTIDPFTSKSKESSPSSEVITVSRAVTNEKNGFEDGETTEFILTSFGSSETATDAVELIKISANPEKSAAMIESDEAKKNNLLTDVISSSTTSDKTVSSTIDPFTTSSKELSTSSEVITVSRAASSENNDFQNVETTEFILTSFGSSETATDAVELIKISANPEKKAAIIESDAGKKNNVLTDLINLVSDVASISENTQEAGAIQQATTASISDSEELIPVNAGYKSKNKNFNQNSITEIPLKNKISSTVNKQKVVEIEDDESESVTDSLPPNDKVEPTTRRPIIDNVSDDNNVANNKTNKKDIEIIAQSYVPTINRRPTKVVMKKNNEKPSSVSEELPAVTASSEAATDSGTSYDTPLTSIDSSAETNAADESPASVEPLVTSADLQPSTHQSIVTTELPTTAQ